MVLRRCMLFLAALVIAGVAAHPAQAQVTFNSIKVSWTTPGDDSLAGTASQFDLRYATSPITAANFNSATRWDAMPAPGASGTRQTVTVTGLQPSTTYYFAIKTGDDVPNWSNVSNIVSATTQAAPDVIRPAALAISVASLTDSTATIGWAATGDDSLSGTATSYDVRFSTSPITAANWASATVATGEPTPAAPGTNQSVVVRGLSRQTTYYFAARVTDDVGNVSALSNVPSATTPDSLAPAAIRDLVVGWVGFAWRAMAVNRPRNVEER